MKTKWSEGAPTPRDNVYTKNLTLSSVTVRSNDPEVDSVLDSIWNTILNVEGVDSAVLESISPVEFHVEIMKDAQGVENAVNQALAKAPVNMTVAQLAKLLDKVADDLGTKSMGLEVAGTRDFEFCAKCKADLRDLPEDDVVYGPGAALCKKCNDEEEASSSDCKKCQEGGHPDWQKGLCEDCYADWAKSMQNSVSASQKCPKCGATDVPLSRDRGLCRTCEGNTPDDE